MVGEVNTFPHPIPTPLDLPLALSYKKHQKSLAYFSHLAPLMAKSKEEAPWHNAPLNTLLGRCHWSMTQIETVVEGVGYCVFAYHQHDEQKLSTIEFRKLY